MTKDQFDTLLESVSWKGFDGLKQKFKELSFAKEVLTSNIDRVLENPNVPKEIKQLFQNLKDK